MSRPNRRRNNRDNTDQLNDIFVGGFDQEFGDELFVENADLTDELFVKGEHLDNSFMSGAGLDLGSHYQLELDNSKTANRAGQFEDAVSSKSTDIELEDTDLISQSSQDDEPRVIAQDFTSAEDEYEYDLIDLEEVADDGYEDTVVTPDLVVEPIIEHAEGEATLKTGRPDTSSSKTNRAAKNRRPTRRSSPDIAVIALGAPASKSPSRRPLLIAAWMMLLIFPVLVGAATYIQISSQPDVWKVRAEVQYRGSAWTETQDIAVQSRSLIAPVAEQFDVPITEFEANLDAGLLTGTQVVRIEYRSTDAEQAEDVVTALAASYITRTSELTPDGVFETLETQRSEVEQALRLAKVRQSEIPPGIASKLVAERAASAAEIDALEQRLTVVESKILDVSLENLDLNANRVPILLTEPFRFSEPVAPKPTLWAGAGLLVATLLSGVAAAFLLNHTSKRKQTWLGAKK